MLRLRVFGQPRLAPYPLGGSNSCLGQVVGKNLGLHQVYQCYATFAGSIIVLKTLVAVCDNIHSWISLSGDLAFSHQHGIYGFKFPKRFLEISSGDLTLFCNPNHLKT